ncbi:hypothetical protein JCM14076_18350 [Methylosoma difficile]
MKKQLITTFINTALFYTNPAAALTQVQLDNLASKLSAERSARVSSSTAGYAQLIGFISDASVSGYVLDVKNSQGSGIDIIKLPLDQEIASWDNIKLSLRGSFNYASIDTKNILDGFSGDTIKPSSEAYSGMVGLLFAIPLNENWTLKPVLDAGVGRIENTIAYQGSDALQAQKLVESLVINWSTNTVLMNTGLGLDYRYTFKDFRLDLKGNYNHTLISSFSESNSFAGFTEQTDLLHFAADLSTPLGVDILTYPLSGVLHTDHTVFLGNHSNALGFSHLNAFGYRFETDFSKDGWYVSTGALGFNYLTGDNVEGYELVFNVGF